MKKLILLVTAFATAFSGLANHITEAQALARAASVLPGRNLTTVPLSRSTDDALYVFNAEDSNGFAIVSSDDRTPAVLGYSETGNLSINNLPQNVQWLIDYYTKAISSVSADNNSIPTLEPMELMKPTMAPVKSKTLNNKTHIEPLLKTQWGQGEPYNSMCPTIGDTHCLTGCVATAMAQIVNYHQWPVDPVKSLNSYGSPSLGYVDYLPQTTIDWNNMTQSEIAKLMRYCGQSVSMDYGVNESGAVFALTRNALVSKFGYSQNAELVMRNEFSDSEWTKLIYQELSLNRPVLYSGISNMKGGHAFVIDGYTCPGETNTDMYHINWGWDGYCDGYFVLDSLDPNNDGDPFVYSQSAIVGILSPKFGASECSMVYLNSIDCEPSTIECKEGSDVFDTVTIDIDVCADITVKNPVNIALGVYNTAGELIDLYGEKTVNLTSGVTYSYKVQVTLPASLSDTQYHLVPVNKAEGSTVWLKDINTRTTHLLVVKEGSRATVVRMPNTEWELIVATTEVDGVWYRLQNFYGSLNAYIALPPDGTRYKGDLVIPKYVDFQGNRYLVRASTKALYDSPELTSLTVDFNEGITLYNCNQLQSLILKNVVSLDLEFCDALQQLALPPSTRVISIDNCKNLKALTLEANERSEVRAINHPKLPSLTDIYIHSDVPPLLKWSNLGDYLTVHIPVGTIQAYRLTDWGLCNLVEDIDPLPVEVKLSYCGTDDSTDEMIGIGIAAGRGDMDVEFAIRIPSEHLGDKDLGNGYIGAKITAIEFHTSEISERHNHYDDVDYVFVTFPGVDYLTKAKVNVERGSWQRVELANPVEITGEDLFVGIGRNGILATTFANMDYCPDGLWVRAMGNDYSHCVPGQWERNAGDPGNFAHPIEVRAVIEGDNLPNDINILSATLVDIYGNPILAPGKREQLPEVTIDTQEEYFTLAYTDGKLRKPSLKPSRSQAPVSNQKGYMMMKILNQSPHPASVIGFNINIEGQEQEKTLRTYLLPNHQMNALCELEIDPIQYFHILEAKVTTIDGETDQIDSNSTINLGYKSQPNTTFSRKFVLEEGTGTWCGWCPLGIVTIESMRQKYPGNFIPVCIHIGDEMVATAQYNDPFIGLINSAVPSGIINRTRHLESVYPNDIEDVMCGHLNDAEAEVTIGKANLSEGKLQVEATAVFGFNDNGSADFSVAYAIVEDQVGPYYQTNFYSDPQSPDDPNYLLNWWTHQQRYVPMKYGDVARDIFGGYNGVEGLLPRRITEGEAYSINQTIDLPDNIDDAHNLKVVVMLILSNTGEILNADVMEVASPDGLNDIFWDTDTGTDNSNNHNIYYDLLGRPVLNPTTAGIYIRNGRKVFIK